MKIQVHILGPQFFTACRIFSRAMKSVASAMQMSPAAEFRFCAETVQFLEIHSQRNIFISSSVPETRLNSN